MSPRMSIRKQQSPDSDDDGPTMVASPLSSSPLSVTALPGNDLAGPPELSLDNKPNYTTRAATTTTKYVEHQWPLISMSHKAARTHNPIRQIVDPIVRNIRSGQERGDGKDPISLALGDPTATDNLPSCPAAMAAISKILQASASPAAGYIPAVGRLDVRTSIAAFHSSSHYQVAADQVVVANGCSGALELALTALLNANDVLLVPQPGFPLYQVIAESHGARVVHYRLCPERHWQIDLAHLEQLLEEHHHGGSTTTIRGMVLNNPSNPTGAVFSSSHLGDVIRLCERWQLPVIADEVYGDLVFGDHVFHPLADVVRQLHSSVPVITASGIGKQFLLPGWRIGWLVFCDNEFGSLRHVRQGVEQLAQVILGASHLAQCAVPALLNPHNALVQQWKADLRHTLEQQGNFLCQRLSTAHPALTVLPPAGAMYVMMCIDPSMLDDTIHNDLDFCRLLLHEENVVCLPGSCFGVPHACRLVFCAPQDVLAAAADRMQSFCERHTA